jgi:hypothetical protein
LAIPAQPVDRGVAPDHRIGEGEVGALERLEGRTELLLDGGTEPAEFRRNRVAHRQTLTCG